MFRPDLVRLRECNGGSGGSVGGGGGSGRPQSCAGLSRTAITNMTAARAEERTQSPPSPASTGGRAQSCAALSRTTTATPTTGSAQGSTQQLPSSPAGTASPRRAQYTPCRAQHAKSCGGGGDCGGGGTSRGRHVTPSPQLRRGRSLEQLSIGTQCSSSPVRCTSSWESLENLIGYGCARRLLKCLLFP